jgi:hypothetical protein
MVDDIDHHQRDRQGEPGDSALQVVAQLIVRGENGETTSGNRRELF